MSKIKNNELHTLDPNHLKHVLAGKIIIDKAPKTLQILGLGSCVAITFYFPEKKIGAMAHIVLPARKEENQRTPHLVGKYANSAIGYLLDYFKKKNLNPHNSTIKLTGGSNMFGRSKGILNIADRNIESIKQELAKSNLKVKKSDLGGTKGRSIYFDLETGEIRIFLAGGKPKSII